MTDSDYGTPTENTDELWREAFVEAGAETLAEIHQDWDREKEIIRAQNRELQVDFDTLLAPLKERLTRLEAQVEILLDLFGSADSRTKSKRFRQPDNGSRRLLEPPRPQ
jgi:hypothetical protein